MTLPQTLTLVRHGKSEANLINESIKRKEALVLPNEYFGRHDSNMRLTPLGVEQAQAAGDWLRKSGTPFDRFYVSPHVRTLETASNLKLNGEWRLDDRLRERDWGEIRPWTQEQLDTETASSKGNRELSEWYWKPQAGESLATGVRLRVESISNSLHRKQGVEHCLFVTHGEWMRTEQMVSEKMTPAQWERMADDPAYYMQNCMILEYTRVNPEDGTDIRDEFKWRRAICPWDETLSWDDGQWVPIGAKKFSDDELTALVEKYPRLF